MKKMIDGYRDFFPATTPIRRGQKPMTIDPVDTAPAMPMAHAKVFLSGTYGLGEIFLAALSQPPRS